MTFLAARLSAADAARRDVCPDHRLFLEGEKVRFAELEKPLICGDTRVQAWSDIPLNQRKYSVGNFLQERGYHHPDFKIEGDALIVSTGERTRAKSVSVTGAPADFNIHKKRLVVGRPLTPKLLDEVEKWTRGQLEARGYPCPEVKSRANIDTGEIVVEVETGPLQDIASATQESVEGLGIGTLRRYDAFRFDGRFNAALLELSERRVEKDGVLQGTHFTWTCKADGAELFQRTFAGKPRLFTVGFGFDSEEYGIFKTTWSHTRWGSKASNFKVSLYASFKRQRLDISSDWHLFSPLSRWYLVPGVSFEHDREKEYHYLTGNVKVAAARTWDNQKVGWKLSLGPNLNYTDTFRGAQLPGLTRFLTLQYEFELMSHDWEFWQFNPRRGYRVYATGDFGNKNLLSDITAQRFKIEGQYLYNFRGYDPPLLIFGVRGGFYGTIINQDPLTFGKLPPNYRYYLGGSQNLRGFSLEELPNSNGSVSAAWAGVEIRLANLLPLWIQPLVFVDAGILGQRAFHFQTPVYLSPGGGLRVASPIGVFRTTFARGLKFGGDDGNPNNTHFQFFISYGEEF